MEYGRLTGGPNLPKLRSVVARIALLLLTLIECRPDAAARLLQFVLLPPLLLVGWYGLASTRADSSTVLLVAFLLTAGYGFMLIVYVTGLITGSASPATRLSRLARFSSSVQAMRHRVEVPGRHQQRSLYSFLGFDDTAPPEKDGEERLSFPMKG